MGVCAMTFFIPGALFVIGIAALVWGGDRFVGASCWIAQQTGVPKFVVGATVVSFATTLPELIVSLLATLDGSVDMAVGNAVGSVSANIGLIMGISLLILPGVQRDGTFWAKGLLMIGATALLGFCVGNGQLELVESLLLMLALLLFFYMNLRSMRTQPPEFPKKKRERPCVKEIFDNGCGFVLGLAGILLGARLLVDNGSRIARMLGASEALIGLTFVAIGTSLPELITTISAITRHESELSVGNILGANIIDITMILSSCAIASGGALSVGCRTSGIDIPVTLMLMAVAVIPAILKKRFYRMQGLILLVGYGAYVAYLGLAR